MMPFRKRRFTPPTPTRGGGFNPERKQEKPLTGKVKELKASQGEERIARVLYRKMQKGNVRDFMFRTSPGIKKGLPGWRELDYEVNTIFGYKAISVVGVDFVHRGEVKKNQDKLIEVMLLQRLREEGKNVMRIDVIKDSELKTEEDAEKALQRIGIR